MNRFFTLLTAFFTLCPSVLYAQSSLLSVDGELTGIKGVNLPWLDGAYGHDFGHSAKERWAPVYSRQKAEARFSDIGRMGCNVMRVWVFQGYSGVVFDNEGLASGIDPRFLSNIKEAVEIADRHGVNCYLCLLTNLNDPKRLGHRDVVSDRKARSALIDNVIVPFTREMKSNEGVFAFDLVNEPEGQIRGNTGNWTENGYTWDEARTFFKEAVSAIHRADRERRVSIGSGWHRHENVMNGMYLNLGLDFFDFHEYRDDGYLVHPSEIRQKLARLGASKRDLTIPILIGECGQDQKNDDEIQRRAVAGFLNNARTKGYAGVLVWSYEWPGVSASKEWDRLLKGDGDSTWRPAAYEIKNFRWSAQSTPKPSPEPLVKMAKSSKRNPRGDVVELDLSGVRLGDAEISALGQMTSLRRLTAPQTGLSDEHVGRLTSLANLTSLGLWQTQIGNDGLKIIGQLRNLSYLSVEGNRGVTDNGLAHLTGCKRLSWLGLSYTGVSDNGMRHLAALSLTRLDLKGTKITNAGLQHIARIKSLRTISLANTRVTDTGVTEFQRALPNCKVEH